MDAAGPKARRLERLRRSEPGLRRGPVGRREHGADRRSEPGRRRGRRLGVRPHRRHVDTAGSNAGRDRRDPDRPGGLQRRAVGRRQHGTGRWTFGHQRRGSRVGVHPLGRDLEPTGSKARGVRSQRPGATGFERRPVGGWQHRAGGRSSDIGDNETGKAVGVGAAWVFTWSGATWTQQGSKLVGSGATDETQEGHAVALSADGNTALLG